MQQNSVHHPYSHCPAPAPYRTDAPPLHKIPKPHPWHHIAIAASPILPTAALADTRLFSRLFGDLGQRTTVNHLFLLSQQVILVNTHKATKLQSSRQSSKFAAS
jgi:hypothetical protein